MNILDLIEYTDERITKWYKQAKEDYGVIGVGKTYYNDKENKIIIEYTEDGIKNTWEMAFYLEYLNYDINWVFNCWCELA